MSRSPIATLSVTLAVLRLLVVLNGLYGAAILALLVAMLACAQWTMSALGVAPSPDTGALIMGMRAIAVLGLVAVPLNFAILTRLIAIVETVRVGDPFVTGNASRLQAMAWILLGLQILSMIIGTIAATVSTPANPLYLDAGFSTSGWLAVLLTFVLAKVFSEGARLRDDLAGTV